MNTDTRSLSPKEYAQRHGVTTRTVHRWIKAKRLHVIRFSKRTIRIVPRAMVTDADTLRHIETSAL
jgi:excisionase family DNA binding protein